MRYAAIMILLASVGCADDVTPTKDVTPGSGGAGGEGPMADGDGYIAGTRLVTQFNVGLDGSRQPIGFYDTDRSEACSVRGTSDGKLRCVPEFLAPSGYYGDAGCTQQLAQRSGDCTGNPPKYAGKYADGTCGNQVQIHDIGPEFTGSSVYVGASCLETTPPEGVTMYVYGAVVQLTAFQEMQRENGTP